MLQKILTLTQKFISIQSVQGNTQALREVLDVAKNELIGFRVEKYENEGVGSFLISNYANHTGKFKFILNAHLDVVPGIAKQYSGVAKDNRLYGRGAYDMKAAGAAMIMVFAEVAKKVDYPLGLQITTDEEIGGKNGTNYQIEKGTRAEFVISREGTNFSIVNENKTRIIFKLSARGKSSHAAYPWLGENAIGKMQNAIYRLQEKYPLPTFEWSGTTLNITSISTNNQASNIIPDYCEAVLDARVVDEERETILETVQKIVTDDIKVKVEINSESHHTDPDNYFIKALQEISNDLIGYTPVLSRAHGESDIRYYNAVGCEGIEFGPIGGNHHADDEWVDIKSLEDYYLILKDFLLA